MKKKTLGTRWRIGTIPEAFIQGLRAAGQNPNQFFLNINTTGYYYDLQDDLTVLVKESNDDAGTYLSEGECAQLLKNLAQ